MTLVRWRPFGELEDYRDQVDRVFDEMWRRARTGTSGMGNWLPAVDLCENEHEFKLVAELPGMSKDQIKITLNEGMLTLRGEKKAESQNKNESWHHVERTYGTFERSFQLSTRVNKEKVTARFENGVLTVHLPKTEDSRPREIDIS